MKAPLGNSTGSQNPSPLFPKPTLPVGDAGGMTNPSPTVAEEQLRVEGIIEWLRVNGTPDVPQDRLDKAFGLDFYWVQFVNYNQLAHQLSTMTIKGDVLLTTGPHDNDFYRVTYTVHWHDPGWPIENKYGLEPDLTKDERGKLNYLELTIAAPWPANNAVGPGYFAPISAKAVIPKPSPGPARGPTFRIQHFTQ